MTLVTPRQPQGPSRRAEVSAWYRFSPWHTSRLAGSQRARAGGFVHTPRSS